MYLNSIKVSGFKSFAEEVDLLLEPGITTIVGPNGCGKSNVSDAIRWVLGEQSARALRCTNMRDLLFNGGANFNPSQKASVTLSFTDISENLSIETPDVEVGRQLTRDGESSYHINKTACRLRDISELFMDTGVGVDAYSVMEQSKIDMILNVRPEERRFLFDEVAGITKSKHNKKTAIRKLEDTKQNLIRINDVIQELERETESLKSQAEQAEHFKSLKEKQQKLELSLAYREYEKLAVEHLEAQNKLNEIINQVSEANQEIQDAEDRVENASIKRSELDTNIASAQEKKNEIEGQIEKIERELVVFKENQVNISQQRQRALQSLESLKSQHIHLQSQKKERIQQQKRTEAALKIEQSRLSGRKQVLQELSTRIDKTNESIQEAQNELQETNSELTHLQSKRISIEDKVTNTQDRLNRLKENSDVLTTELNDATQKREEIQQTATKMDADLLHIDTEKKKVETTLNETQDALRQIDSKIRGLQDTLGVNETQHRTLTQMQSSYRGYYAGVSAIMQAKEHFPEQFSGVCGVVAELIQTQNDYEVAIEVALGSAIQNVIAETAEDADAGIRFLKKHNAGRVTFLPLDIIRRRTFSDDKLLDEPCVIGVAEDLVDFDYFYQPAVQHLLGNTLVIDNLDNAISLKRRFNPNARLVTVEGELINTTGAITGGHTEQRKTGLLSRNSELDVLQTKINELTLLVDQTGQKRKSYAATIAQAQQSRQQLSSQWQDKKIEKAAITKDIEQIDQTIARIEKQIAENEVENKQHKESAELSREEQQQLNEKIDELTKKSTQTENRIKRVTEGMDSDKRKREEVANEVQEREVFLAGQQGNINGMISELQGFEEREVQINEDMKKQQEIIDNDEQTKQDISDQIKDAERQFLQIQGDFAEAEAECDELIEERDELISEIEKLQKDMRGTRRLYEKQNRTRTQLEIETTQLEMRIKSNSTRILEKYQVSIEELPKPMLSVSGSENEADDNRTDQTEINEIDMLDEIEKLKAELVAMGDVNLKAIEAHQEHKKRLDFLVSQREDVQQSIQSSYQAIQKINETSCEVFLKTFEQVKSNFQEVFVELFGGGETELQLTDESNILESGIDIIARPPGKRPQSITQLSGGERSLVAIGLLFAVFKIKPSPFCVLDEVDAALDEANVLRFTNLIRTYSNNTQFVIITHNNRTMEIADVMYGVTMEQAGMSKIVSKRFSR